MADKFRRKKEPKHIRLYASITGSEAWKHLSGNAVKVLLALVARDDGSRNGHIGFSCREAADVTNLSTRTCWRCFVELQDKGFIVCTEKGGFSRKVLHSTLWRYTWAAWPGGRPAAPTRDFEKWRPDGNTRLQVLSSPDANSAGNMEMSPAPVVEIATREVETPVVSANGHSAKTTTLIVYQGDGLGEQETEQRKQANPCIGADLAFLRESLLNHLGQSDAGEQSRLANRLDIPPGTLSKFIHGKNLPEQFRGPLADRLGTSISRTLKNG